MNQFLAVPLGGSLASKAQGNSGAGVFSIGTSIVGLVAAVIVLILMYKNFEKITDFIFKRDKKK